MNRTINADALLMQTSANDQGYLQTDCLANLVRATTNTCSEGEVKEFKFQSKDGITDWEKMSKESEVSIENNFVTAFDTITGQLLQKEDLQLMLDSPDSLKDLVLFVPSLKAIAEARRDVKKLHNFEFLMGEDNDPTNNPKVGSKTFRKQDFESRKEYIRGVLFHKLDGKSLLNFQ